MRRSYIYLTVLVSVLSLHLNAQIIPDERRINWNPGIPGGIPQVNEPVENVMDYGADSSGKTDSYEAFITAIDKLPSAGGVLYIPEGTYRLKSTLGIDKSNVIIRGAGKGVTKLMSEASGVSIRVGSGMAGDWQKIRSGHHKGSSRIEVENGSAFSGYSFIEIQQENDSSIMYTRETWIQGWAENSVGQVLKISGVDGNKISLKTPLHHTFSEKLNPVARPVQMVKNVGIEDLYIEKLMPVNHTVFFHHTAYCWMQNVESYMTKRSHVRISVSLGLEIRACYFHRSYDYGGGGHGYGVECSNHTTNVLVENNIFDSLRHAMMVQTGANGNVFAYNYSAHPVQGAPGDSLNVGWIPPDISVHGHYPFMNLFEGNDVMEIGISDYWGPAGPGNTYLRNRVRGEGIFCYDHSHEQNLIGNTATALVNQDNTCLQMVEYGNIINDNYPEDQRTEPDLPDSFYLDKTPGFFNDFTWPPFGPDSKKNNILPAQKRYK